MVMLASDVCFSVSGKCGDKVYGITDGVQWLRAWFIPPNPQTVAQENNRAAMGIVSSLFGVLPADIKAAWIKESEKRVLPKPNFFNKRGMLEYVRQLGAGAYASSVDVSGLYPDDVWVWSA